MKAGAPQNQATNIIKDLKEKGLQPVPLYGVERTVIAVIGEERDLSVSHLESQPGVVFTVHHSLIRFMVRHRKVLFGQVSDGITQRQIGML